MSLLTICQNAARYSGATEIPTVIAGSSNDTASMLFACADLAGKELARRYNWLELVTEYTFSTVASQQDYDLPSDYKRAVNLTWWDRTNFTQVEGPLSPQQWQEQTSSVLAQTSTTWKKYRIRKVSGSTKISLFPTPDAADNLVFEYASTSWCESSGGTGQDSWQADTDVGRLDEHLIELGTIWRFLDRMGLDYGMAKIEYEREVNRSIARDGGAPVINISRDSSVNLINSKNVPDTGFGS